MKKTKITITEFGKIVEEIPASKADCRITNIYLNNFSDDTISYLKKYISTFCYEKLLNCMIHWNNEVESLYHFCEEFLVY